MRVVVDARRLQDRPLTGAGRWLAHLVPLLAQRFDLLLLTDRRREPADLGLPEQPLGMPPRVPETVWLQVAAAQWLRRRRNEMLFHGTFNAVPLAGPRPWLVTIFDLSFEHHPEDFRPAKRALFRSQARWAARRAPVVLTVSEHARSAIVDTYGVAPERIAVAPPSVDPVFRPRPVGAIVDRRPYIVAIGGAQRRGLETAIVAWRDLRRRGPAPDLVVVGAPGTPIEPGLTSVGRVDDQTWARLLAGAELLCYPTRFEGYGMPALEAAASGVPVVCGRVGPLPEVLGEAAEWCDHLVPARVADAMERVVGEPSRRRALRDAGILRAGAAPTWSDSAAIVASAYDRAMAG